jgi:uncharacterized phage protein (TIGR02220 family)
MTIVIDTDKRDELGISTDAYILSQAIWLMRSQDRDAIEQVTGWPRSKIGATMNEIEAAGLFTEATGDFSDDWKAIYNPMIDVDLGGLKSFCEEIISFTNETTGRSFQNSKGFQKDSQRIIRAVPVEKATANHFKAIIKWAHLTWNEPYRSNIGPNLFKHHTKYMSHLEKAAEYFRTKNKSNVH